MQFTIKISFVILTFFLTLSACRSESGDADTTQIETAAAEASSIQLTPEQMALAGIEIGKPEERRISGYVDCTGKVEVPPESLHSVYSSVSGFVGTVRHLPGDYIRQGTLLTTIRHPDLVRLQREWLEVRSRLSFLQEEYERQDTLAAEDAASRKALGQARADYETAQARYQGLKAELELIGIRTAELEASGEIQSSVSLHAPRNGYLTQVNVNPGKLISPQELLFEIVDDSHLHLELQVFAKDLEVIRKGQRIECNLPGSDKTYRADVYLIGKMIDQETKTTRVHGHFEKEPVALTPGTYVQARIRVDERTVLALPQEAFIREGDRTFVFVKQDAGFNKVPVRTGKTDGGYVELTDFTLGENELLVVKGAYYVNGMAAEE